MYFFRKITYIETLDLLTLNIMQEENIVIV